MDIYAIRRANLDRLVKRHDSVAAFCRAASTDSTLIYKILAGGRNMGAKLARSIEASCQLTNGWIDRPEYVQFRHETAYNPAAGQSDPHGALLDLLSATPLRREDAALLLQLAQRLSSLDPRSS